MVVRLVSHALMCGALCLVFCGCTSLLSPISSIPASRLPPELLASPRANMVPVDLARLRQPAPDHYRLNMGDVLGVYIEGVLGSAEHIPPVHYPEKGSDVTPAFGYPVPIREDGAVSLPLTRPILVRGLTVPEAEERIRNVYVNELEVLRPDIDRVVVTLVRKRTVRVIVVREDATYRTSLPGGTNTRVTGGTTQTGTGYVLDLPAHNNDLMHALAETGGLPGLNATNEVKILRAEKTDWAAYDDFVRGFYALHSQAPCASPPIPPDHASVVRIPLRLPPGVPPPFTTEDVVLHDGDIVHVQSRDAEVFYTSGLLASGQFPLPRDYDLDVLEAVAIAGQGLGTNASGGLIGGLGGANPTRLYVIRRTPIGAKITIGVDLDRAIVDPKERLLVQAGDMLILRHKSSEELANLGLASFFTYGIAQLFAN